LPDSPAQIDKIDASYMRAVAQIISV